MKGLFILVFSLGFLLACKSQSLVKEGRMWSNTSVGTIYGSSYKSYFIKFEGDTLIKEKQYKIIMRSDDAQHENWYKNGYIREDSSQKVFIYNSQEKKEEILYDFGLETGDSILSHGWYIKVDSVKYDSYGSLSDTLKFIFFDYGVWIERIGSVSGVLDGIDYLHPRTGESRNIICYYENNTVIFHYPSYSSCFPVGVYTKIEEDIKQNASIKASYHNHEIILEVINANIQNSSIQLFDLCGKKVFEKKLHGEKQIIISNCGIRSGIYLCCFRNNDVYLSKKIMITSQ